MKSPKYFARTKICMQEQTQCGSRNYKFARSITSEYFKNRPSGRFFDFVGKGAKLRGEGMKSPKYFARTKICMQEQTQCSSRNYKFARSITSEYFKNRPSGRFFDFVGKGARLARTRG